MGKAGSTPRRKLNFGKGPRMTSSGDLKDGNGCNGVGNGSGGGGVMTRSRTLPVLVQQQDKSSFTNKMYQVQMVTRNSALSECRQMKPEVLHLVWPPTWPKD